MAPLAGCKYWFNGTSGGLIERQPTNEKFVSRATFDRPELWIRCTLLVLALFKTVRVSS